MSFRRGPIALLLCVAGWTLVSAAMSAQRAVSDQRLASPKAADDAERHAFQVDAPLVFDWLPFTVRSPRGPDAAVGSYGQFHVLAQGDEPTILDAREMDELTYPTAGNQILPSVSADGRHVSFVSVGGMSARAGDTSSMWVVDTWTGARGKVGAAAATSSAGRARSPGSAGRQRLRVAAPDEATFELAWSRSTESPRRYAFTAEGRIFVGSPNARRERLLLDTKAYVVFPRWSPDDRSMVFASGRTGPGDRYKEGGREKSGDIYGLADLDQVFARWRQPSGSDAPDGSATRRVRLTGHDDVERTNEENFASWASARQLVYHSYRGANGFDLSTVQWPGTTQAPPSRRVFSASFRDELYPSPSPRGDRVAFYYNGWIDTRGRPNGDVARFALFVADTKGQSMDQPYEAADVAKQQVTTGPVRVDTYRGARWSPTGEHLIYIADRADEGYPIYVAECRRPTMSVNREPRPLTDKEREVNCTSVDVARDSGKLLVYSSQVGSRRKVFLAVTNFKGRQQGTTE